MSDNTPQNGPQKDEPSKSEPPEHEPPKNEGSIAGGFFLGVATTLMINFMSGCADFSLSKEHFPLSGFLLGVAVGQALITLPLYRRFKRKGKINSCRGLIIGAAVSCLVGVACGVNWSISMR